MRRIIYFFFIPLALFARSFEEEIHDPKYEWMDGLVREELKSFINPSRERKINKALLDRGMFQKKTHVNRYQVIENLVIGEGKFKKTLEFLTKEVGLPNLDLLYYEFDGPVRGSQIPSRGIPIFSGSKNNRLNYVFLIHDPTFQETNHGNYDWKYLYQEVLSINEKSNWKDKTAKMIWRGATTGPFEMYEVDNWKKLTRGRLVDLSTRIPHLIDAKFCHVHPWKTWHFEDLKKVLPQAPTMSHKEQIKYKYQIVLDGDTCTYPGLQWRLLCNSLLFKPASPLIMWFDKALIPWKHYIPVHQDLSDLEEKINWAMTHDEEAEQIAKNATCFAREFLSEKAIYVYCYKILTAYAQLLE